MFDRYMLAPSTSSGVSLLLQLVALLSSDLVSSGRGMGPGEEKIRKIKYKITLPRKPN